MGHTVLVDGQQATDRVYIIPSKLCNTIPAADHQAIYVQQ